MRTVPAALALLVASGLAAGGCATGRSAAAPAFSYLAVGPGPLLDRSLEEVSVSRGVEARVMTHVFLWIPTRTSAATLEEAVGEALRRGGGDVLANASAERVAWYVPPFYGREGWIVRGDAVRLRERSRPPEIAPPSDPRRRPGDEPSADGEP
jgi:hypothetical protein